MSVVKQEFYPRMIPVTGTTRENDKRHQTGNPVKEIAVGKEEDHIRLNAADHAEMLADHRSKPTMTAIATATEEAAANQREADARIAESFGDEGKKIAEAIRRVSVHEASVEPAEPPAKKSEKKEVPAAVMNPAKADPFKAAV